MPAVDPYPGCETRFVLLPWAHTRVVMVGQAPSAKGSHDPRHALTGAPMRRLFKCSGLNLMLYLRTFERHNLVGTWEGYRTTGDASSGSRFDPRDAAVGAKRIADRLAGGRRLLCWGKDVMAAFVGPARACMTPLTWYTEEVVGFDNSYDTQVAIIPHPSGLNRWWNDPANREAAGKFLRGLADEVLAAQRAASDAHYALNPPRTCP